MADTSPNREKVLINSSSVQNSINQVKDQQTNELVIALIGPIGTPLRVVYDEIKKQLSEYGYTPDNIHYFKVSEFIVEYANLVDNKITLTDIGKLPAFEKKMKKIELGNELRRRFQNSFLIERVISEIFDLRTKNTTVEKNEEDPSTKIADAAQPRREVYIIDSIKNQEELDLLRLVYRDLIYCIGVSTSIEQRVQVLEQGIAFRDGKKNSDSENELKRSEVWSLIDEESGEEISYGQTVKDTFQLADYFIFVNIEDPKSLTLKIQRFLEIVFDAVLVTPTLNETAMYMAYSASLNSACLSRQVGAALTDRNGEVISVGWNDVPKYGGGLYQNNNLLPDQTDERCFQDNRKICYNDKYKNDLAQEIIDVLLEQKFLTLEATNRKEEVLKILRNSRIGHIVEFSRSIHAEMHALLEGSIRAGERVREGKMFITTYPCHICARHLILAGINEVYYIEPYRKSLTKKLHSDSITEDEDIKEKDKRKVRIRLFEGIGPNRYRQLFKMLPNSRKTPQIGTLIEKKDKTSLTPKSSISLSAIPTLEAMISLNLQSKLYPK